MQSIARSMPSGIGPNGAQFAMMSFARYTRQQFGFDSHTDIESLTAAMDRSRFHGGYRSKIGSALTDASAWIFQQAEGLSFSLL